MKKSTLLLAISIFFLIVLSACDGVISTVSITINFETNGGSTIESITYDGRRAITMPEDPTKDGFVFDGWYWDNDTFERSFTANSLLDEPVSNDLTVYAKWVSPLNDYETWKNSDEAEDLNGDRKIDEADFEIYSNPSLSDYELWKNSIKASDYNNDGVIDDLDYTLFLEINEFYGTYSISNYVYEGRPTKIYGSNFTLQSLGEVLIKLKFMLMKMDILTQTFQIVSL